MCRFRRFLLPSVCFSVSPLLRKILFVDFRWTDQPSSAPSPKIWGKICSELITANRLYSCFYLSLHSLPQFLTLCFARCSLGSQRPPVRCITFVYCHDNRHVITSYFFIFCLYCVFVVSLPANRWLIAPSRPVA